MSPDLKNRFQPLQNCTSLVNWISVEFLSFTDFGCFYFIRLGVLIFDNIFTKVTLRWALYGVGSVITAFCTVCSPGNGYLPPNHRRHQTFCFQSVIGAQCENGEITFRYLTRDKVCDNGKERRQSQRTNRRTRCNLGFRDVILDFFACYSLNSQKQSLCFWFGSMSQSGHSLLNKEWYLAVSCLVNTGRIQ